MKEKEIEWVLAFNRWLEKEVQKYGYSAVKYKNDQLDMAEIEKYI